MTPTTPWHRAPTRGLLALPALLAGCPAFPSSGVGYGCASASDCAAPLRCLEGACVDPCAPRSCGYASGVSCGACARPERCGEDERCAQASGCAPGECGLRDGLWCGACPTGEACEPSTRRCAPVDRAALCWGPPIALAHGALLVPAADGLALELYASTTRYARSDGVASPCRDLERGPAIALTAGATAVERLAAFTFPLCATAPERCHGGLGPPSIRADGLELFVHGSFPCDEPADQLNYHAHRARPGAPWSRLVLAPQMRAGATAPVFLPGDRTLVYGEGPRLLVLRRGSDAPDDLDFEAPVGLDFEDTEGVLASEYLAALIPTGLSCDGRHLLYTRSIVALDQSYARWDLRIAALLDPSGPALGPGRTHSEIFFPSYPTHFQESPGCETLYVGNFEGGWARERVPCP